MSDIGDETSYSVLGDDWLIDSNESFETSDEDEKETLRFILVEGPPGIGKSTFAWEVCRRWDEIETTTL